MGSWVDGLVDWRIGGFTNAKEVEGFTVDTRGLSRATEIWTGDQKDNGLPMKNRNLWEFRIRRVESNPAIRGIYGWLWRTIRIKKMLAEGWRHGGNVCSAHWA